MRIGESKYLGAGTQVDYLSLSAGAGMYSRDSLSESLVQWRALYSRLLSESLEYRGGHSTRDSLSSLLSTGAGILKRLLSESKYNGGHYSDSLSSLLARPCT